MVMAVPPFEFEFRCPIAAFRKQSIYSLKAAMGSASSYVKVLFFNCYNVSILYSICQAWLAASQRRFRFLDLCIRFGKMISKACPVGNLFSFGVCEGFNSGAKHTKPPIWAVWCVWLPLYDEIRTHFRETPDELSRPAAAR